MKCCYEIKVSKADFVTLHVRVWIEIIRIMCNPNPSPVTLHVRVWIEIVHAVLVGVRYGVTLHVRVWIEITDLRL